MPRYLELKLCYILIGATHKTKGQTTKRQWFICSCRICSKQRREFLRQLKIKTKIEQKTQQ
uniref:Uncharacterized protein n=1 Tax=Anguilla anguilla TaxID=7936 RepID=A0A0E9T1T5_ANGAN